MVLEKVLPNLCTDKALFLNLAKYSRCILLEKDSVKHRVRWKSQFYNLMFVFTEKSKTYH